MDGEKTQSFCYVDDLIEGFIRLMGRDESIIRPVNLGNPGEFTIKELAQLVIEKKRICIEPEVKDFPADDSTPLSPDISHAEEKLDIK